MKKHNPWSMKVTKEDQSVHFRLYYGNKECNESILGDLIMEKDVFDEFRERLKADIK